MFGCVACEVLYRGVCLCDMGKARSTQCAGESSSCRKRYGVGNFEDEVGFGHKHPRNAKEQFDKFSS